MYFPNAFNTFSTRFSRLIIDYPIYIVTAQNPCHNKVFFFISEYCFQKILKIHNLVF